MSPFSFLTPETASPWLHISESRARLPLSPSLLTTHPHTSSPFQVKASSRILPSKMVWRPWERTRLELGEAQFSQLWMLREELPYSQLETAPDIDIGMIKEFAPSPNG